VGVPRLVSDVVRRVAVTALRFCPHRSSAWLPGLDEEPEDSENSEAERQHEWSFSGDSRYVPLDQWSCGPVMCFAYSAKSDRPTSLRRLSRLASSSIGRGSIFPFGDQNWVP